jgi:hypothetical protein
VAEKTILVCDACGQPASQLITIRLRQRSLVKDLCDPHVAELTDGARPAKRGRPKAFGPAAATRRSAGLPGPTRDRKRTHKQEQPAA